MSSESLLNLDKAIREWHENRIGQLKEIIKGSDNIVIQGKDKSERVVLSPDVAKGVRLMSQIAIELFEELPYSIEFNN